MDSTEPTFASGRVRMAQLAGSQGRSHRVLDLSITMCA